jgi:hypothetical protein
MTSAGWADPRGLQHSLVRRSGRRRGGRLRVLEDTQRYRPDTDWIAGGEPGRMDHATRRRPREGSGIPDQHLRRRPTAGRDHIDQAVRANRPGVGRVRVGPGTARGSCRLSSRPFKIGLANGSEASTRQGGSGQTLSPPQPPQPHTHGAARQQRCETCGRHARMAQVSAARSRPRADCEMGATAGRRGGRLLPPADEDELGQPQSPRAQHSPQYGAREEAERPA